MRVIGNDVKLAGYVSATIAIEYCPFRKGDQGTLVANFQKENRKRQTLSCSLGMDIRINKHESTE